MLPAVHTSRGSIDPQLQRMINLLIEAVGTGDGFDRLLSLLEIAAHGVRTGDKREEILRAMAELDGIRLR